MVLAEKLHVSDEDLAAYIRQQAQEYEQDPGPPKTRNHFEARMFSNLARQPRHDTVPDPQTGRRHKGNTADIKVRIYLQFPTTGDMISLRVHPELRLGPQNEEAENEAAEAKAQEITRRKTLDISKMGSSQGHISRLKAKFFPKKKTMESPQKGQAFTDLMSTLDSTKEASRKSTFFAKEEPQTFHGSHVMTKPLAKMKRSNQRTFRGSLGTTKEGRPVLEEEDSLKEQIYRLTGLLPSEQRLFYNKCILTQNHSSLRDYGIGHGDTLSCMQPLQCSPVYHGHKTKNKINLKEMCPMNKPTKGFRFMPRWQTQAHPRLFEVDPTSVVNTAADAIFVFDYSCIPDHGHTDFCGKIRRMHGIT